MQSLKGPVVEDNTPQNESPSYLVGSLHLNFR
jgi:hypothetical protein